MAKTTANQREEFYHRHISGDTYQEIADEAGVSRECIRYWCRRLKKGGSSTSVYPGRPRGLLQTFDPKIRYVVLKLRKEHPNWGPVSILNRLEKRPSLEGLKVPSPEQIKRYLHQWPRFHHKRKQPKVIRPRPIPATRVHERWQIDFKMGIPLHNGRQVNLHTVRDEFGSVCIEARVTDAGTIGSKARRVTDQELKETLRRGFARWSILPEEVQTDNEPVFASTREAPFPTSFTLWLAGLGIRHHQIRGGQPTDNAEVERCHQTIMNHAIIGNEHLDVLHLQTELDESIDILAFEIPSRARGCYGKPPVEAHPALMRQPFPFLPDGELALFRIERVHAYLAQFTWTRKVGKTGQICLGGHHEYYSVGRDYARKIVLVRFDPQDLNLVFYSQDDPEMEIQRQPLRNVTVADITGLDPDASLSIPVQMPLPFPVD